jgi:hypothetical protein
VGLAILAIPAFVFRRPLLGAGVLYERDIITFYYPQAEVLVRSVAAGSLPLWDPYRGFGEPFLADPEKEIYYPPNVLNLIFSPNAYFTLFMALHVAFAGLGMYLLVRSWGSSRGAALTSAALWMGSGPLLSLSTWHHLAGASWMPWVLLLAHRTFGSWRARDALLFGLAEALQILAGSAEMVILTGVATLAYSVSEPRGRRVRSLVLAGVIGVGLSACQWVPTIAALRGSTRTALPASSRTVWSLNPLQIPELVARVRWADLPAPAIDDPREVAAPFLPSLYLGAAALALVLAAFVPAQSPRRRVSALVFAGAFLVALGRHGAAYPLAVLLFPPLRLLRFPVKYMVLASFAWAHLAGLGFEALRAGLGQGRRRLRLLLPLGVFALLLAGAAAFAYARPETWGPWLLARRPGLPDYRVVFAPSLRALALSAAIALAALLLSALRTPRAATLLALLAAVDLATAHENLHKVAPKALVEERPPVLKALAPGSRLYVYDYSVMTNAESLAGRRPDRPWPYRPVRVPRGWGEEAALFLGVQEYLNPPAAERWGLYGSYDVDLVGLESQARTRVVDTLREVEGTPAHLRLLQLGAVDFVLSLVPAPYWDGLVSVATVPSLFADPIRVFRVPDPLPRAYAVGTAEVEADDERTLKALLDPGFDPRKKVILAEGAKAEAVDFRGNATLVELRPDRVRLRAELGAPGYLILTDAYDPGWRASVDGAAERVLRANGIFRAVAVPAGTHAVEFVYRPASVPLGLALTALTLVLSLASLRLGAAPERPSPLPGREG